MQSAGRVAPVLKGTYSASATYNYLDVINYAGSSYFVKQTVTGVAPPDPIYYQLLASGAAGGAGGATVGTSSTAAGVATKIVATLNTDYDKSIGSVVWVAFDFDNTADNVQLNIDGTGAASLSANGTGIGGGAIKSGVLYQVIYDGTNYCVAGMSAEFTSYNNSVSNIRSNKVQGAIDELDARTAEEAESAFNRFYGMCNKVTEIFTNAQNNKQINESNYDEAVNAVTIISTVNGNKQITTTATPDEGNYYYSKITTIASVASVKLYYTRVVAQVTPEGGEVPFLLGWYELNNGEYVLTTDLSVESGKDYYTITYTATEATAGSNPASLGLYEKTTLGYVATADTAVTAGKRITETYTKEAKA